MALIVLGAQIQFSIKTPTLPRYYKSEVQQISEFFVTFAETISAKNLAEILR